LNLRLRNRILDDSRKDAKDAKGNALSV